jgi:hypothetical protein
MIVSSIDGWFPPTAHRVQRETSIAGAARWTVDVTVPG